MTTTTAWWRHQAKYILFDSGFWIGLIKNESDDYNDFFNAYIDCIFLIPYPSFAEFLNDMTLRSEAKLGKLRNIFLNPVITKRYYKYNLEDEEKDSILKDFFSTKAKTTKSNGPSFVDIIIGRIIIETNYPFVFATTNSGDFSRYINNNRRLCKVIDFRKKTNGPW